MQKTCPRCSTIFECNNHNIADCHCIYISLDARQLEYIGDNYPDCLCNSCLQDVKDGFYSFGINPLFASNNHLFNMYHSCAI